MKLCFLGTIFFFFCFQNSLLSQKYCSEILDKAHKSFREKKYDETISYCREYNNLNQNGMSKDRTYHLMVKSQILLFRQDYTTSDSSQIEKIIQSLMDSSIIHGYSPQNYLEELSEFPEYKNYFEHKNSDSLFCNYLIKEVPNAMFLFQLQNLGDRDQRLRSKEYSCMSYDTLVKIDKINALHFQELMIKYGLPQYNNIGNYGINQSFPLMLHYMDHIDVLDDFNRFNQNLRYAVMCNLFPPNLYSLIVDRYYVMTKGLETVYGGFDFQKRMEVFPELKLKVNKNRRTIGLTEL